jgi:hypothetical protein
MRDLVAALAALLLVLVAASLATTLHFYRRRRQRAREAERARGRTIIAELATYFYYGDEPIEKDAIAAVRVLINGAPIATTLSPRHAGAAARPPTSFEDHPEGIARDRWDVALETATGTTLVACGAIRERVSQELARAVYDAVKAVIERPFGSGAQTTAGPASPDRS